MDIYTKHGESITVPDLRNLKFDEIDEMLGEQKLKYKITDSSYVSGMPALAIIAQNPKPSSKVKENRTIYLTVNAKYPPKITMPNLRDASLKFARSILETNGLRLGKLIYKPGQGRNVVLSQEIKGQLIKPGEKIFKNSEIDLILSSGYGSSLRSVPNLFNLVLSEAEFILPSYNINLGKVSYDESVTNESLAKIYQQSPKAGQQISIGEFIDIYLTQDESKLTIQDSTSTEPILDDE